MPKQEISYKDSLPLHQVMSLLENLVDSLKKGTVCLKVGGEYMFLKMNQALPMEIQIGASEKKGKNRISLELTWREANQKDPDNSTLTISSQPPSTEDAVLDKSVAGKKNSATRAKGAAKKQAVQRRPKSTR